MSVENTPRRRLPRSFSLPWGSGEVIEEASVVREHWEPTIQLLRFEDGSESLRVCHYQGTRFGRSPMILDVNDLEDFPEALKNTPRIAKHLVRLYGEFRAEDD